MFTIHVKADVTIVVTDDATKAQLARIEQAVEASARKLDALLDALVPGRAVDLGLTPGPITEQS